MTDTPKRGRPRSALSTDYPPDAIREAIIARVEELGYDRRYRPDIERLAVECGGSPGYDALRRYFARIASLNTRYVSTLCGVLGLELRTIAER